MIKEFVFFCSIAVSDHFTSRAVINQGGKELNPVLRGSKSKQILFHSGKCLTQAIITSKVPKKKRKKMMIIGGIISGGFVVNNLIQMRRKN